MHAWLSKNKFSSTMITFPEPNRMGCPDDSIFDFFLNGLENPEK
jgi:hypothetical protein